MTQLSATYKGQKDLIAARALRRSFGEGRGVLGVDLFLVAGECVGIIGRNGSGKTTLARLLIGLDRPDSGSLKIFGQDCTSRRPPMRSISAVVDTSVHWDVLTGRQNAFFVARSYGLSESAANTRLDELFELADLAERADDAAATYSYGMRRKLSIIEALCANPPLLVLDEPTIGLDPLFISRLSDVVKKRIEDGMATVIATNDPEWCAEVATKVIFMEDGAFASVGTVEELLSSVGMFQEVDVQLQSYVPISKPEIKGISSYKQSTSGIAVLLDPSPALIPELMNSIVAAGGAIRAITVRPTGLRDAFFATTGQVLAQ